MIDIKELEKLKKYSCIYVVGHSNPDADTIFSSLVLTNIFKFFGINAKFTVLKDSYNYSYEDEKVINTYLKEKPIIIDNTKTKDLNFVLVDHNDPEQSIKSGNIICSFDHHIDLKKIEKCYSEEYTSTLLYIYELFKNIYNFSDYEKELIAITVICDSEYLASSRFSKKDKILYNELGQKIDIKKFRNMFFKITDLSKPIDEIFKNNYKKYNFENKTINRISIKAYEENNKKIQEYIDYIQQKEGIWIIIWCEYDTNKSYIIVKKDDAVKIINYNYIATSSVLVIKDLLNNKLI